MTSATEQAISLNDFQERTLGVPEEFDLFLGGGRGGGKSYGLALIALRHVAQYGERARILYLRQTYKGLADFELLTRELFGMVYGTTARYNGSEHVWRFPNGAYLELGQLETAADYAKYQGRSFTLLLVDEAGQFATPDLLDMMRSNLRGPKDLPIRAVIAANPGGAGHQWLASRYVFTAAAPWTPYFEPKSKRQWVYAPSTLAGNHFIDREQYREQLESMGVSDPELLRAWIDGDWAIARGAFFGSVLDEKRNAVDPWKSKPEKQSYYIDRWNSRATWEYFLTHDFGSAAPSATYLCALSNDNQEHEGKFYPKDSIVLIDELATNRRGNPNIGLGWTVPTLAEEIKAMCARWDVRAQGVADDAVFSHIGHSTGSIAEEFRRCGVYFHPAKKGNRIDGWQRMNRLLAGAGKPDVPGLYISRACRYFWETVPYLARDQRRIEDVDTSGPDHAADAVRYGCLHEFRRASVSYCIGI